jgi:tetratricopeptide (TPR) repeat protein
MRLLNFEGIKFPYAYMSVEGLHQNGQRFVAEAKYESAISCFEEMKKLASLNGDERSEAVSLQGLGIVYNLQGQYALANGVITQSIDINRRIGNALGEAESLISLGNMILSKGDYSRAIENYNSSLSLFRTLSDLNGEGAACHSLGNTYHLIGQYDRAVEMLNRSLHVSRQIGNSELESASSQVC